MPDKDGKPTKEELDAQKVQKKRDEDFEKLQQTVSNLALVNQQTVNANKALQESMTKIGESLEALGKKKSDEKKKTSDDDIDDFSNSQLMSHMLSEFTKIVDGKIDGVTKEVGKHKSEADQASLQKEVTEFMEKHSDFREWGAEIKALNEVHPTLNVAQLYKMARDENPDKATEIDEKIEADKKDGDKDKKKTSPFGGLTPTSGKTVETEEKLTKDEAGEKAWSDTVADFPFLKDAADG